MHLANGVFCKKISPSWQEYQLFFIHYCHYPCHLSSLICFSLPTTSLIAHIFHRAIFNNTLLYSFNSSEEDIFEDCISLKKHKIANREVTTKPISPRCFAFPSIYTYHKKYSCILHFTKRVCNNNKKIFAQEFCHSISSQKNVRVFKTKS